VSQHDFNHTTRRLGVAAPTLLVALSLAGCAPGERARSQGMDMIAQGKYPEGVGRLAESVQEDPGNAMLRKDYLLQRNMIVERLLMEAGAQRRARQPEVAEQTYRRVLSVDPNNTVAQQGLNEIEVERRHEKMLREAEAAAKKGDNAAAKAALRVVDVEAPGNAEAARLRQKIDEATVKERIAGPTLNVKGRKPLTLQFRDANLKMVLEAIARTTGVNIVLDKEVRSDIKVTLFVKDSPVEEALDLLLMQNQLEKRVLGENTVLIYPGTPAKNKDYLELKIRRFALGSADPKQVQTMLKTIVKTKDIFVDEKTNSVVIRDTPEAVRIAETLITAMDQPEPEVMLEIDVMQVDRNRLMQLGIDWTKSFTWSLRDKMTRLDFKNRTLADYNIPGLSVTLNASKTDGDINDLATPRIRVRNKEKAKILVGTRNPVVSSAQTPSPAGGTPVYNTSVQYIETGIKLEVEPHIHPDGDVAIKLALEVSSAGARIVTDNSGTVVFPVNTNNVTTVLQLKDGETQILGGLIQRQDDQSQSKIPGFGDVPGLGRLFGSTTDTWNKKELVMAITPHIVRNSPIRDADSIELWSGTEGRMRYGAPNVKAAGGTGVVGQSGGGAPALPTPSPSAFAVPVPRPLPAPAAAPVTAPVAAPTDSVVSPVAPVEPAEPAAPATTDAPASSSSAP
jgi:general secretion pathway protein D